MKRRVLLHFDLHSILGIHAFPTLQLYSMILGSRVNACQCHTSTSHIMMKIAIAGTNGLAQFIAYYLSLVTSHNFVFLTRNVSISPIHIGHGST